MNSLFRVPLACSLALICCCAGVPAISGPTGAQAPPPASPSGSDLWHVTLSVSGGFAGFDRTIDIRSTGETNAIDRRRATRVSSRVTAPQLTEIATLVQAARPSEAARQPSQCRDCLSYAIDIDRGGERLVAAFDDTTLTGSSLQPLVDALAAILNRSLTPK